MCTFFVETGVLLPFPLPLSSALRLSSSASTSKRQSNVLSASGIAPGLGASLKSVAALALGSDIFSSYLGSLAVSPFFFFFSPPLLNYRGSCVRQLQFFIFNF